MPFCWGDDGGLAPGEAGLLAPRLGTPELLAGAFGGFDREPPDERVTCGKPWSLARTPATAGLVASAIAAQAHSSNARRGAALRWPLFKSEVKWRAPSPRYDA